MSGVRAPKGLFHVRDPLAEILDRSGGVLATLPHAAAAAQVRRAVEEAEALARRRLSPPVPTSAPARRPS
jgi:hypothetical protein